MRLRTAFTLVELLVVVGIIAIIFAMLLPALRKAQEQAQRTQCMSNLRQMVLAVTMYASENKGRYPGPHKHSRPNTLKDPFTGFPLEIADLRNQFRPFVKNPAVLYCPANLEVFNVNRVAAASGEGWFEGWNFVGTFAGVGFNYIGYNYWPQWIYDGMPGAQTIWIHPNDQPGAKMEPRRRIIASDLTQSHPAILPPIMGYDWYAHGRGGGTEPEHGPKTPTWAARAYSDGSVVGAFRKEWELRVITSTGLQYWW